MLQDLEVSPTIHVIIGRGMEARTEDLTFADVALEGDDPATISDDNLKHRVERWLDLAEGTLNDRVVNRPGTGNIIIKAPDIFGG